MLFKIIKHSPANYSIEIGGKVLEPKFGSASEAESYMDGYKAGYAAHVLETTPRPLGELLKFDEYMQKTDNFSWTKPYYGVQHFCGIARYPWGTVTNHDSCSEAYLMVEAGRQITAPGIFENIQDARDWVKSKIRDYIK